MVVVNTAARNNKGVSAYGETLNGTLAELRRRLVTLWVINRQRDSLELLKEYMRAIAEGDLHVVRNCHFGEEAKFELYNRSNLKSLIEERGGLSLNFPDLADRVSDDLYSNRDEHRQGSPGNADRQPGRARPLAGRGQEGTRRRSDG